MNWLRRIGRPPTPDEPAPEDAVPEPVEGAAPGIAALLEGVSEDRSHAVLDLGPAADQSLQVYSRFARWIRFADLLGAAWPRAHVSGGGLLKTVIPKPPRPYDLVFAWDILDRLFPEDRAHLTVWLADYIATRARLHVVVRASDAAVMRPLRFILLDTDRIRFETTGTTRLPPSRLLPADVAKLLSPFQVVHAFNLKSGLREYVAVKR